MMTVPECNLITLRHEGVVLKLLRETVQSISYCLSQLINSQDECARISGGNMVPVHAKMYTEALQA